MRAILLAGALLAAGAASAAPTEIRYLVGLGERNSVIFCVDGTTAILGEPVAGPSVGGACTKRIAGGALTVDAIDDATGETSFFYDVRDTTSHLPCQQGSAVGPLTLAIAPGCDEISVAPFAGSLSGIVRLA